jgi:excisionase family DNA binding protein
MPDLSHWLTEPEAVRRLGISWRTLMRRVKDGTAPERRMRPRAKGKKPEPVYDPEQVAQMAAPKPQVLRANDPRVAGPGMPERPTLPAVGPIALDLTPIALAFERVLMARLPVPSLPPPAPKPYITAWEAAESLGVSEKLVKRLVSRNVWPGFRDGGAWKLRSSDVATLDVVAGLAELKRLTEEMRHVVEQRKAAGQ